MTGPGAVPLNVKTALAALGLMSAMPDAASSEKDCVPDTGKAREPKRFWA
jgi:hypothetical protein